MPFADALRQAMGNMTQKQLAALSGVPQTTLSSLLLGKKQPRYRTVVALEKALPSLYALRTTGNAA